jgi:rhodanese-related sulfurtransferase
MSAVPEIDPAGAKRLADEEDAVLLDVREDGEWAAGHAPGATHLRLALLAQQRPERGRRIIAVCRTGARSGRATEVLNQWGYDAVNLAGGMKAWAAAGLPVVDDAGGPGTVA